MSPLHADGQSSGHDGWGINVAIDSNGSPHVLGIDPSQFGSRNGLEYATLNGDTWTVENVGSGPLPYEVGNSIKIDSQGRPHVVWFDDANQDLKYAQKDAGDVGRYPSLTLDQDDKPMVSYLQTLSPSSGVIRLARWDGSGWNTQRVDQLDYVFPGFFGTRKNSSVVVDADGNPVVAYSDESVVKLASWNGADWDIDTVATADNDEFGQQASMAVDSDGVVHLTFADVIRKRSPGVLGPVMYSGGTS